ncbi:DJ-1/PfpI family protein [Bradyrhizobium tropiciagri]|uniref:DJ-1/PfpI family protein n=1 Tax=Bradyrhizobium tropiciagri TaxID=312253 RepID=UPI001FCD232B|nr:DJ-1/PfpI family protein [Bradyrhizobium tropiciagri]
MSSFVVAMLVFDGLTHLDLAGPMDALARMPDAKVELVSQNGETVKSDLGFAVPATHSFASATAPDLIFVGGGSGVNALMEHAETLAYLAGTADRAAWVTSVCTGALVLGAAGLLRGYRATTHWTAMEALVPFGARPVDQRVVIDRNRITGGGVTAGIEFGLEIVRLLHGSDAAQAAQLGMEYNPAPPFKSGSPRDAQPEIVSRIRKRTAAITAERIEIAKRVASSHGWS